MALRVGVKPHVEDLCGGDHGTGLPPQTTMPGATPAAMGLWRIGNGEGDERRGSVI